jgi:hypothetical protein
VVLIEYSLSTFYARVGNVRSVTNLSGLDINSMNAKVVCDNGVFVLKITNEIDVRSLSNILEIQSWLYSEGIIVPNPVLTDSAQYFVRLDNRFVILFDFIDGRVYRPELSNIGTFLGCASELFLKLRTLHPKRLIRIPYQISTERIWQTVNYSMHRVDFWEQNSFSEAFSKLKPLLPSLQEDLMLFSQVHQQSSAQYSHYDLHPKNVLVLVDKQFGFLDFNSCGLMNPNIAWGFLLIKTLREALVKESDKTRLLEIGKSALSDVTKTSFSDFLDVPLLPVYGRFEILRRLSLILEDFLSRNSSTWLSMLPVQIQLLRESYLVFGKVEH